VFGGKANQGVAVSPNGQSVYVTDTGGDTVFQYSVGYDGTLTPKSPATVTAGTSSNAVAVSPDGESVFVANFNSGNLSQYDVRADGALTPKSPATVVAGFRPDALAVTPAPVPSSIRDCKNGGWRNFPQFKNQGQCIAFVNHAP
jgi:6-phosphogluconolactonase (cycloisomerase 2 family)